MSETTLKNVLEELCAEKAAEFKRLDYLPHFFSRRHRKAMDKILYPRSQSSVMTPSRRHIPLRNRIIIVMIIIFVAMLGVTAGADKIGSFAGSIDSNYIEIEAVDYDDAPRTLDYIYYLDPASLPEGVEVTKEGFAPNFYYHFLNDKESKIILALQQIIKCTYHQTITEDYEECENITINGKNAIYTRKGSAVLIIWDSGDYIIHLAGNLPKEDMIKLLEKIKRVKR